MGPCHSCAPGCSRLRSGHAPSQGRLEENHTVLQKVSWLPDPDTSTTVQATTHPPAPGFGLSLSSWIRAAELGSTWLLFPMGMDVCWPPWGSFLKCHCWGWKKTMLACVMEHTCCKQTVLCVTKSCVAVSTALDQLHTQQAGTLVILWFAF